MIFHFFRFYYAEMRRKLWPKAPAKETALSQMSNKFQVYFIHMNFFKKPNKISLKQSRRVILRRYYIYFFILYCLLVKKIETEKWPKAVDSPLKLQFCVPIKGSFSCKRGLSLLNFERGLKKTMGCLILKLYVVVILYQRLLQC